MYVYFVLAIKQHISGNVNVSNKCQLLLLLAPYRIITATEEQASTRTWSFATMKHDTNIVPPTQEEDWGLFTQYGLHNMLRYDSQSQGPPFILTEQKFEIKSHPAANLQKGAAMWLLLAMLVWAWK